MIRFSKDYSKYFKQIWHEDLHVHPALGILVDQKLPKDKLAKINSLDNYIPLAKKIDSFLKTNKNVKFEKLLFSTSYFLLLSSNNVDLEIISGIRPVWLNMIIKKDSSSLISLVEQSYTNSYRKRYFKEIAANRQVDINAKFNIYMASDDYYYVDLSIELHVHRSKLFSISTILYDMEKKVFLCDEQIAVMKLIEAVEEDIDKIIVESKFKYLSSDDIGPG